MMTKAHKAAMLTALIISGCGSIDFAFFGNIDGTTTVDLADPGGLSDMNLSMELTANRRGGGGIYLHEATLGVAGQTPLLLEVVGFDNRINDNETIVVALRNIGTTNQELAAFCGQVLPINVELTRREVKPGDSFSTTSVSGTTSVVCL